MAVILPPNQGESRGNGTGIILHGNYMIGTIFMWIIFNLLRYHYLPRNWWALDFVNWDHGPGFHSTTVNCFKITMTQAFLCET